jgi:DNA-binding response OmpR family regulator
MPDSYRILLVDDDKDTREMMSVLLTLENSDYEVFSAADANEALTLMQTRKFDLYILDSLLPDMSGVELCARVRRFDKRSPILFYSGMLESNYIKNAKAAGANEYLVKPDDLGRLSATVEQYLN